MKRILSVLSLLVICALAVSAFAACGKKPADDSGIPTDLWGVSFAVKNPTATSLTLTVSQSGSDGPTGTLQTGATFRLEQQIYGHWLPVETILKEGQEYRWPEALYEIPAGGSADIDLAWEGLYGVLPAGHYRIAKAITDFRAEGDYDAFTFYAEFDIAG